MKGRCSTLQPARAGREMQLIFPIDKGINQHHETFPVNERLALRPPCTPPQDSILESPSGKTIYPRRQAQFSHQTSSALELSLLFYLHIHTRGNEILWI